jgi:adenylosuccinate synthase
MPLDIIVGCQWGDEGKGRITDLLAAEADIVARYSGGDNAGHTVTVGERIFQLHLVPSGIVHPHTIGVLGNGMVINPASLLREIEMLRQAGVQVTPERLKISTAAHLITPAHLAMDAAEESRRGERQLGTTRRGIGPAYTDKAARRGLRAGQMADYEGFGLQVLQHMREAQERLAGSAVQLPDPEETARQYADYAQRLRPFLTETCGFLAQALEEGKTVLAEGAQGTLLDLDHGTYPYVTSSHPTSAGALLGLGVGPGHVRRVIGVAKAFQTRVGSGPFPTELHDERAIHLRGSGANPWDEFGTTTGRPRRCGWLDGVLLRYAARLNGLTELALTKLDVLAGLEPLRVCVAYEQGDQVFEQLPRTPAELQGFAPRYENLPGWRDSLWECRQWQDLPAAARQYVEFIERLVGLPVTLISVGPERDQVVVRQTPTAA